MQSLAFIRENRRWLLGGYLLTFFASLGQTFFISLSAGHIRTEYGLSHGAFGLIFTVSQFATGMTMLFLGPLVDRFRPRDMVIAVVAAMAVGALSMALSTSVVLLALTLFVLRLAGPGMMTHLSFTTMGRWFAAQRGRAVAASALGINTGEALLPFFFVKMSESFGWRTTWLIAAAATAIIAVPLIAALYSVERKPRSNDAVSAHVAYRQWTQREVRRNPMFYVLLIGVALPGFVTFTIFFHQVYLVELKGWSMDVFALSFALMAMSTFTLVIVSGLLIDRFSARVQLPFFLLPMAAGCILLATIADQRIIFVIMLLFGITLGFAWTLFGALWAEVYGTTHLGSVRALVASFTALFVSIGPALTGYLIDAGLSFLIQIFAVGMICACASVVLYFAVRALARRPADG